MHHEPTYEIEDSFSSKVKHNFKTQLLLCLKGKNWTREDILCMIYKLPGYKCHKVARYGYKWSHIHIKFEEESQAEAAIVELGILNADLAAVLVDDMLREWYNFEMKFGPGPSWTITIVDTVGRTPHSLNFLTENILNYLFQDFGQPYLLPYTAALNEVHVQMTFYSMTEALAACMAFGQWYRMNLKLDQFCYRVRINPAQRETFLIRNCGGNPDEAFMLDYFINVRNEATPSREANGWDNNRNENRFFSDSSHPSKWNSQEMLQNPSVSEFQTDRWSRKQNKIHQNEGRNSLVLQKKSRYRQQQTSMEYRSRTTIQQKRCTPLVCVPIITPVNSAYAQALVSSGQLSADFTNALMNFPKTYAEVLESDSKAVSERKTLPNSTTPETESSGMIVCNNEVSKPAFSSEKNASEDLNRTPDPDRSVSSSKYPQKMAKLKKHTSKRSTRVFERRDAPSTKV